ncbi:hypothetical protein [Candidatus Burkholderia verschuerenii]|uniref:hypothetical protein n=1 Tax=Candidatus Burkholderia verschuerenii TaxID=242163 RepID=UPI00067B3714|nr:hypothetical protein [Candidatus Burkholderia verschuerenii]
MSATEINTKAIIAEFVVAQILHLHSLGLGAGSLVSLSVAISGLASPLLISAGISMLNDSSVGPDKVI